MNDLAPLLTFLRAHHVAHLATTGDGGPHSAPVFFAVADDETARLAWVSRATALHSRHIGAGGPVALSIAPSAPSLLHVTGVQMRGLATTPDPLQLQLAGVYLRRFPQAAAAVALPGHRFYCFEPAWIRLVDRVAGVSRSREWAPETATPPISGRCPPVR